MPATLKTCAYVNCDLGENGIRKKFYGTKRALYCCGKHGTYQRRINQRESKANKESK